MVSKFNLVFRVDLLPDIYVGDNETNTEYFILGGQVSPRA